MISLHLDIKPLAKMKENVIRDKSYLFALRIMKLHLFLSKERRDYQVSSQILRSGTCIGANVEEAIGGISKKDFINKLSISYKEARETSYWLRLLRDTSILDKKLAYSLLNDCDELLRILYAIINSSRSK